MTARQTAVAAAASLLADRRATEVIHEVHAVEAIRDAAPAFLGACRMAADVVKAAQALRFSRVQISK